MFSLQVRYIFTICFLFFFFSVQVAVLLIAYDWAIMPVINVATYMFRVPTLAFLITSVMGLFAGKLINSVGLMFESKSPISQSFINT